MAARRMRHRAVVVPAILQRHSLAAARLAQLSWRRYICIAEGLIQLRPSFRLSVSNQLRWLASAWYMAA